MPQVNIYFRKSWTQNEANELLASFQGRVEALGFTNRRDNGDIPDFIVSVLSGEVGLMLFEDDDYHFAVPELEQMAQSAQSPQVAELLRQLIDVLPMEADD